MDHPPDSDAAADARAWQAQREALRQLHREVLDEPVPQHLLDTVAGATQAGSSRWWRLGGLAASLLLAFAAGWLGKGSWQARPAPDRLAAGPGVARVTAFAHDAAVAHIVYAPEKRHPVEVAATDEQHLVQWLSRRLERPLKVPDLSAQGYALVGGRLLPGEDGARAQFMFQDAAGQRVTLYIGALQGPAQAAPDTQESAFRFTPDAPVPSFYWVDRGFGYALAGPLPRERLLALATEVYRQL